MRPGRDSYVIIIGTLDTKGEEVSYLRTQLQTLGIGAKIIDVGISGTPTSPPDIDREEVALKASYNLASLMDKEGDKLEAMSGMASGALSLVKEKIASKEAAGVMALGGGVGTWIGLTIMRALPFGLPKIMISTLPFDIRSDLGAKDIIIFPSVADILGLNPILRKVLQNASGAMAGMIDLDQLTGNAKKIIGITALGVTTPLVNHCKEILENEGFEIAAFHGVGIGGKTFEDWVQTGFFAGVLDVTLHDINNFLFDGISPPYSGRLESAVQTGIPQVVAPGGLDFVSKGPIDTLSEYEQSKKHYRHSPMFTHVRVNAEEMIEVARKVAEKLNLGSRTTVVAIPLGGFSFQGKKDRCLADYNADMTFVRVLKENLHKDIQVSEVDANINDKSFATTVCSLLLKLMKKRETAS
jgi:uncharacterized protein (UPF0261 family)